MYPPKTPDFILGPARVVSVSDFGLHFRWKIKSFLSFYRLSIAKMAISSTGLIGHLYHTRYKNLLNVVYKQLSHCVVRMSDTPTDTPTAKLGYKIDICHKHYVIGTVSFGVSARENVPSNVDTYIADDGKLCK